MAPPGIFYNEETKEMHANHTAVQLEKRGVGFALFSNMKSYAKEGLVAQIDAVTGYKDYYKDFLTRCLHLAHAMRSMGLQQGDIISIISNNHLNSSLPYIAAKFIGVIVAPSDPTIAMEDQRHLLGLVKPKVIFVSHNQEKTIEEALRPLQFECEIITFSKVKYGKLRSIFSLIKEQEGLQNVSNEEMIEAFQPEQANDLMDTCVILFSSGTTGLPKGICLNHNFILAALSGISFLKITKPTVLLYSTLYWLSAIVFQTSCFFYALPRLICNDFDPWLVWEYVDLYEVSVLFLAPIQAILSLVHLRKHRFKKKTLKTFLMGGSSIAPNYLQEFRDLLPDALVTNGYGQTEIGVISMFLRDDDNYRTKLTSVGFLTLNCIARIVDPDTEERLGLNQVGEIRIKTPHPMKGYYNQDTASVWDADGFIKTGDLGYFDSDFCLYITDRIKEMFKYKSWHIVPTKLESILQHHPDVIMAMVMGIPHPIEDNHAIGIVTLRNNATVTAKELEQFVEKQVDERNRLRAGVIILEEMPVTPSGKIMRREVKNIIIKRVQLQN